VLGTKLDLQLTPNQLGPAYAVCCPICLKSPDKFLSISFNDKKLVLADLTEKSGHELLFSLSTIPVTITCECTAGHVFNIVLLDGHDKKIRLAFTMDT
jgi:hypothetical protein